jgi:hypothetical protein
MSEFLEPRHHDAGEDHGAIGEALSVVGAVTVGVAGYAALRLAEAGMDAYQWAIDRFRPAA